MLACICGLAMTIITREILIKRCIVKTSLHNPHKVKYMLSLSVRSLPILYNRTSWASVKADEKLFDLLLTTKYGLLQ